MTEDKPLSILSHLEELRWRIVKMAIAVLIGGIIAFIFSEQLRHLLETPFHQAAPDAQLQTLAATEKWGVLMRIGLFGGVVLGSPVILYQLWAFINPALTPRERNWAFPIVGSLVVLFVGGVFFGYWSLPRGLAFLFGVFQDVDNNLRLGDYYSFALRYLAAFGVAFLFPVFLFAAAAAGLISSAALARGRRWAVLIIVTGAAIITPSGDAFTLMVLSIPLYLMYEATYWLVRLLLKK
ncbi:MAG: twin-arginine translocase subunit TatC [Acidimicrobiia bacterium]